MAPWPVGHQRLAIRDGVWSILMLGRAKQVNFEARGMPRTRCIRCGEVQMNARTVELRMQNKDPRHYTAGNGAAAAEEVGWCEEGYHQTDGPKQGAFCDTRSLEANL